ncbi:LOW QUALITY PROTEIN: EFCB5-like protein [Mya arenaria]|uniref:EFCB5-like protein n=1 Tax=Mya arenaria TaxID=6604 RepID=A0ABY7DZC3_MYAAR|nr:LOW QUALITY PROTEIN: EFCB5-like protein [Mya arenaria]
MTDVQKPGTPKRVTMAGEQRASSGSSRGSGKRSGSPEKRVPSAVQRWKRQHEQSMMEKLVGLRNEKKELTKISREQARNVARKIPTELLGRDWLNMIEATLETRAYLVEKLMPTLILGVEKLLNEADKRGLAGKDARDPNFNPINFLAQHLMRNNPRYSNFSEASPYVRTLREITEELKRELFNIEDNRLARIKSEARRRREEREKNEAMKLAERVTRMKMLMDQFKEWSAVPDGTVELQLLQNALRSFVELSEKFPEHLQAAAKLSQPLESTDESGKSLTVKEFAKYVIQYTDELSETLFERFMMHMAKCAAANRSLTMREARRIHLTNLFLSCDHSGIGLLDRHRILSLFENYWDSAKDEIKGNLCNPRKWPVVEVDEADDSISDEDEEQTPTSGGGKPASPVGGKPASPPPNNQEKAQEQTQVTVEQKQEPASGAQEEKKEEPAKTETAEPEKPTEQGKEAEEKKEEKVEDKSEEQKEESKPEEPKAEQTEQKEATDVKPEEAKTEEAKPETEEVKKETEQAKAETATETGTGTGTVEKTETAVGGTGTETDEQVPQTAETGTSREQTQAKADEQTEEGADKEKEGEIEAVDMMKPKTPATAGQQTVQFADGTQFERDNTAMTNVSLATGQSTFDENSLNVSQFVQVTETFLGNEPTFGSFDRLMKYIKSEPAKKRCHPVMLLDQLFDKWDNDGSGFLDQEEVENVMTKYKDGQESDSIEKAKTEMKKKTKQPQDNRLSRREFRTFVTMVADQMPGADAFEYFVEFLNLSVERTYAERIRGEARKKWLQHIITAADTGGASIDPVYKAVFQALFKDAEAHGGGKNISANIAMLERNNVARDRGDVMLRYVAATTEDADFLLGKILYKDMKGISFSAVESGKPIHVPRVANHGNIMFWNPYRKPDEREGSFIVIPLKDRRKRVFGLLGMDTLADSHTKSIFITHEIQFFQGVSKSFSIAYHSIDLRKKLLRITESAVSWIHRRSPHVKEIVCYIVEPDEERLCPEENDDDGQAGDYLFKAVDNSESVSADAYGEHHLAFPLRNDQGRTQAILDISIGELKQLPSHENREVQQAENNEETRMDIMFDRLMLMELRENVTKVDTKAFAELRSYNDPPRIVHDILKSVTAIFSFQETEQGMFDDWQQMKGDLIPPEKIERYLKNVPHGEVAKHSSVPAQHMYNWVFVCLSLIEHTLKMRDNNDDILPPAKDSAEKERTDEQIVSEQTNEQEATTPSSVKICFSTVHVLMHFTCDNCFNSVVKSVIPSFFTIHQAG